MTVGREFGEGPLARVVAFVYTVLVVEVLLLLTTLPGMVPLVLLDRDATNVPLAALCLLPVGPAVSAALFALRHRHGDLTDLTPATAFWRGYRLNVAGALRIWVPALVWLAVIGTSLAHRSAAGVPLWWTALLVVLAAAVLLWTTNALVINALYAFRTRDVARLSAYFLVRSPGATLGTAGLLILAGAVVAVASDAVLALLGSVFLLALLRTDRPMVNTIREQFVA